ncbi:hypothetical protein [Yersinia enterocolitica]|uniref:hypothetical protein n=1 Tax=Yersinia enterocolitica TaxID=630 RepID=UPI003F424C59
MLSKDKLKYPTEITDEQLRYLITAFENKMTEFYPVGREAEIARQLLSLREQMAAAEAQIKDMKEVLRGIHNTAIDPYGSRAGIAIAAKRAVLGNADAE